MAILATLALGAAWYFFSLGDGHSNKATALHDEGGGRECGSPLQMPDREQSPADQPAVEADTPAIPESPAQPVTEFVPPLLDTPDYGPAIQRGGAFVDFELFDAKGTRVPVQYYGVKLWRKVGSYWLADEAAADTDRNVIRCDGFGEGEGATAGLEPGEFELELFSPTWGSFRHQFSVSRGERRVERLTTPHTKVVVCLRFSDASGNPVAYLPGVPKVITSSAPLDEVARPEPVTVALRSAPGESERVGGMGWFGSGSGTSYPREVKPVLLPTDNGAWWITVYAGGTNTVKLKLGEELWGIEEYTLEDTFTARSEVAVTLNTPADFATRVLEHGPVREDYPAGDRHVLEAPAAPPAKPAFDPYTVVIPEGLTRVVVQVAAPVPVSVQMSLDGSRLWGDMEKLGDVHWRNLSSQSELWIRLADGRMLETPWEKVDISTPGLIELYRAVNGPVISFSAEGLSPTLRAFAYSIDLDLCAVPKPEPPPKPVLREDPETIEEDPSDVPGNDLELNPNTDPSAGGPFPDRRAVERRMDTQGSLLFKMVLRDGKAASVADSERVNAADISGGLVARTYIRGVSRYRKGRSGSASMGPNGNYWFEPMTLAGRWETVDTGGGSLPGLLQTGALQPKFNNVLVARAVGPQEEGLPWVSGVVVRYEDDAVAQQVRELSRGWKEHIELPPVAEATDDAALRTLIGDEAYDAFETREQRKWFVRHGAWYDTGRKVYADEQGYIAIENPNLEAGGYYVLYLWSNSKDDRHPDARFVFKVDDHGVADLGAIHMPTYTD